jgi:hypothetical protein
MALCFLGTTELTPIVVRHLAVVPNLIRWQRLFRQPPQKQPHL